MLCVPSASCAYCELLTSVSSNACDIQVEPKHERVAGKSSRIGCGDKLGFFGWAGREENGQTIYDLCLLYAAWAPAHNMLVANRVCNFFFFTNVLLVCIFSDL